MSKLNSAQLIDKLGIEGYPGCERISYHALQRIADLERELKAEREINDRLRVVETERAVRADKLYEALLKISNCGVMAGKAMRRIACETLAEVADNEI